MYAQHLPRIIHAHPVNIRPCRHYTEHWLCTNRGTTDLSSGRPVAVLHHKRAWRKSDKGANQPLQPAECGMWQTAQHNACPTIFVLVFLSFSLHSFSRASHHLPSLRLSSPAQSSLMQPLSPLTPMSVQVWCSRWSISLPFSPSTILSVLFSPTPQLESVDLPSLMLSHCPSFRSGATPEIAWEFCQMHWTHHQQHDVERCWHGVMEKTARVPGSQCAH